MGDMNAKLDSSFGQELVTFCSDHMYSLSDVDKLDDDTFTYFSESHGTVSWLDHCITTKNVHDCIETITVLYDYVDSDHFPLSITLSVANLPSYSEPHVALKQSIDWANADDAKIEKYKVLVSGYLANVTLPVDAILCKDVACKNVDHTRCLDTFYHDIVNALTRAGNEAIGCHTKGKFIPVPGWNEHVKEAHDDSRDAFKLWRVNGKPKHGPFYELMRTSRARFKYALRACRKNEATHRADAMANNLMDKDYESFWKSVAVLNNKHLPLSSTVGGATGCHEVATMWADHFSKLLNSVKNEKYKKSVEQSVSSLFYHNDMYVSPSEVIALFKQLANGKSAGPDGLTSEHLNHAGDTLAIMLSLLFGSLLVHVHLPLELTKVILIPLIKNRAGDVTDRDNYRPIALATTISKLLERIIFNRCEHFLETSCHQFGFKKGHATDMCIYVMKEVIQFYTSRGSPVFACFLDARKAFDRVNHWTLLKKLLDKGVPNYIVKLLMVWLISQQFCIQWGPATSEYFTVSNGVRQGGIISPLLFNFYVNDLNAQLVESGVGCNIGGTFFNNLSYADDMVLLCPSVKALRKLLSICEDFAAEHDIIYNTKKTKCMLFRPSVTMNISPIVKLTGVDLNFVQRFVYLGHIIVPSLSDDLDIGRQYRSLCSRANMLKRKFFNCSDEVKITLFKSYCTSLYTSQLWTNYTAVTMKKFIICFNNAFRWLMGLSKFCSASTMFIYSSVMSYGELRRKLTYSFMQRILKSNNILVKKLYICDVRWCSVFYKTWNKILYT